MYWTLGGPDGIIPDGPQPRHPHLGNRPGSPVRKHGAPCMTQCISETLAGHRFGEAREVRIFRSIGEIRSAQSRT